MNNNSWEKLYQSCIVNCDKIIDIDNTIPVELGDSNYLINDSIIVSITGNRWTLSLYPEFFAVSLNQWCAFLSLCRDIASHYDYQSHHCGLSLTSTDGDSDVAYIMSYLLLPPKDSAIYIHYNTMKKYLELIMGSSIITKSISVLPYAISTTPLSVGLNSMYGPILVNHKKELLPLSDKGISSVSFPEARKVLTDKECDYLQSLNTCWIDNYGVHVTPKDNHAITDVAQAIYTVTRMHVKGKYSLCTLEHPMDGMKKDMPSDNFHQRTLFFTDKNFHPWNYIHDTTRALDYDDKNTITKGAFR